MNLTLQKADAIVTQLSTAGNIPNSTRLILGLPLEPEPEVEKPEEAVEAPLNETNQVVNGNIPFYSIGFCANTEELAYETSLNFSYN